MTPTTRRVAVVLAIAVAVAAVAFGATLGLWYLPFVAGALAGATRARFPGRTALVLLVGPLAWAAVLLWDAGRGATVGATARTVSALAGLPPTAFVTVVATLLVALLQATAGGWLGRAITHRGRRS
ncbi:MAG TPA: hypothetical protein VFW65_37660 [Pseudonocardiaceae bacterium]|nr:hypothetical protein [Pseudonocardiaceae bacterium]